MKWKKEHQILETSMFRQMLTATNICGVIAETGLIRAIDLYREESLDIAIGKVASGKYIAELPEEYGVSLATYDPETGLVEKAHVTEYNIFTEYLADGTAAIDKDMQFAGDNAVIYLAMMQELLSNPDILESYGKYVKNDSDEVLSDLIKTIHHAIYESFDVKLQDPVSRRGQIKQADIDMGKYANITEVSIGCFDIFCKGFKKTEHVVISEDYSLGAILNESQRAHVKELPANHVASIHEKKILDFIKKTHDSSDPIMNFMLIGPPGTGKSQTAIAVSSRLGLPYYPFVCSRNTDEDSLLGCIMPRIKSEREDIHPSWPDEMEIDLDPAGSLCKVLEILKGGHMADSSVEYEYNSSVIVEAFENGGVLEIQEPSALADPSVLTILNDIMNSKDGILITPKGVIRRHPNTVVIYTTNPSTDIGYNEMQKAVKDRVLTLQVELTSEMMRDRISLSYPELDIETIDTMVDTIELLDREIKRRGINGTAGMRALKDWAHINSLDTSLSESFCLAVLNRVTTDSDEQEILADLVAQNSYLLKDVPSFCLG